MKILSISDIVDRHIYNKELSNNYGDVDLILSAGDLPVDYLDFVMSSLNVPLYYVFGNHDRRYVLRAQNKVRTQSKYTFFKLDDGSGFEEHYPLPEKNNLDMKIINYKGILIGGLEGSMWYNGEFFQYTEGQMRRKIWRMIPKLLINKIFYKRYIDILLTHSPPYGIHDGKDKCHTGFKCFLDFMDKYKPKYLIHGHKHIYRSSEIRITKYNQTTVINTCNFQVFDY